MIYYKILEEGAGIDETVSGGLYICFGTFWVLRFCTKFGG